MARARPSSIRTPVGAYGLTLTNVERARPLLVPAQPSWPRVEIRRRIGRSSAQGDQVTESEATVKLRSGGEILIDRAAGIATFVVPHAVRSAELVHPLLAPVGAVMGYWLERESFHASAFVVDGRAWALIGDRGAGKSTTAAHLAAAGISIASDDLVVLEGTTVLPGPRSIDLRREAAGRLGAGEALGVVGARERWRLRLPAPAADARLAGWIFLGWADRLDARPVRPAERLTWLHGARGVKLAPRDHGRLLDLAALPAWKLTRPRRWSSLGDAVQLMLETVG